MEIKKIIALTVLAIVALPSLTVVMGLDTFAIEGFKYEDKNRSRDYDEGDPGVEGVTITLTGTDADGTVNIDILTDEYGHFIFNVKPGTYTVTETVPDGWLASTETSREDIVLIDKDVDLGFVFGNYMVETETDINCAIERASNYLTRITGIVDALTDKYSEDPEHPEYHEHMVELTRVNEVLGYGEVEGAKDFLIQAMEAYDLEDYNLAARKLAAARNILGRVNGMLTGTYKANKVDRIKRFMDQVRHRIKGLEDKIGKLSGRFGVVKTNNANAAMSHAWGNIPQIGDDPSDDEISGVMEGLVITVTGIDTTIDEVGGDDSTILKAIDRLEAKIWVLKRSSEKLAKKDSDTSEIDDALITAEDLLNDAMNSLAEGDMEDAEDLLGQAEGIVSDASNNLRTIRTQNQVKNKNENKGSH